MKSNSKLYIDCPRCGAKTVWQDNAFRPFCSERCKLIDLGQWADEQHRIAGDPEDQGIPDKDDETQD